MIYTNIVHSSLGSVHLFAAIIAMITGLIVILKGHKGNISHQRIGYIYVFSMLLLNGTAFGIYNFGKFSMFHFFAIVSLVSLTAGMLPMVFNISNKMRFHYRYMSWSVVGLYAAFVAEFFTRFVHFEYFWVVVMIGTIAVSAIGGYLIEKNAKRFLK
ncbi:DUF2306 domain-containing protein [Bernardetia sp. ABR2-2B]|uniref:DUF2306 domain-containing protein n=1 Tax=Bernardetia sp. ABR2-2B TaxID=3127472 RepID=UPI0030D13B66